MGRALHPPEEVLLVSSYLRGRVFFALRCGCNVVASLSLVSSCSRHFYAPDFPRYRRRDVRGAFVPGKLRAYLDAQYAPLSDVIQACVVGHSDQLVRRSGSNYRMTDFPPAVRHSCKIRITSTVTSEYRRTFVCLSWRPPTLGWSGDDLWFVMPRGRRPA